MKVIHLIRHAKSSWDNPTINDFSRTLNKRGEQDLAIMSERLKKLGCKPDYFISSPAIRTKETSKIIAYKLGFNFQQIVFEDKMYESSLNQVLQILNAIPNNYNNVIIVGHNPTLTLLSNYLTDDYIDNIPTCGIVKIELDIENWQHIILGIGVK